MPVGSPPDSGADRGETIATAAIALGGALTGLGHLWAPLAWLGVAVMAAALAASSRTGWAVAGLGAGGLAALVVGHPWQADFVGYFLPWKQPAIVWAVTLAVGVAMTASLKGPVALGWLLGRRFGLPVALWLPPAWAAGEAFLHAWSGVSYHDWLYTQWQTAPVLRMVGWLGWTPALVIGLAVAAGGGEAIAQRAPKGARGSGTLSGSFTRRDARRAVIPLVGCGLLALAPALAPGDPRAFDGLAAVHFASPEGAPRRTPESTQLLVWPEGGWPVPLAVPEGPGQGARVRPPIPLGRTAHLLGARTVGPAGVANSMVSLAADGAVMAARAKRRLFPFSERAVLGMQVPGMPTFRAGQAPPVLKAAGRPVGVLICLEALDREMALEAKRQGARLLAICSSDLAMGRSEIAARQMLAVAVLRAVESGLPVIRAARGGPAALILPDGRVLAASAPGTDGVLTRAFDAPPTGRAPAPGTTVEAAVLFDAASPELGAALPPERCTYFRLAGFSNPGVRARTVVLVGHSDPPRFLGQPPARVAAAVASFRPELVVLDTCYGASTPILDALAAAGVRAVVAAPPFRIPIDGLVYGHGFLDTPDPIARAALVGTWPSFPILRWKLAPEPLARLEAQVAALGDRALRRRLRHLHPPLVKAALGPGAPVLVALPASRW